MIKYRFPIVLIALLVGFLFLSVGVCLNTLHLTQVTGKIPKGEFETIELPWRFEPKGIAIAKVEFNHWMGSSRTWRIIPDDRVFEIKANGYSVNLRDIPLASLRDYRYGFSVDLGNLIKAGHNEVVIKFRNTGGPGALVIRPGFSLVSASLLILAFTLFAFALGLLFNLTRTQFGICFLAVFLACSYWSKTGWDTRTHDVGGDTGHYGYVKYIVDTHALPVPNKGWVYYHPPVYYYTASLVKRWADFIHADDKEFLQSYALFLWLLFLIPSLAVLQVVFRQTPQLINIASLALVTWPAVIFHSIRIGNDAAFYAMTALAFWALVRWWYCNKRGYLVVSAFFCMLGLLCKSNALIICACVSLCIAYRFFQASGWQEKKQRIVDGFIASSFFVIGLALSFATRIYYFSQGKINDWVVSNSGGLAHSLRVPRDIKAFIPLDIPTFVTTPFMDPWNDSSGRGNFWNFLLRSSISGEFSFSGTTTIIVSIILGVLILALVFSAGFQFVRSRQLFSSVQNEVFPFTTSVLLFLAALIVLRIAVPYACSNDFRYILPMLPSLLIFTVAIGVKTRIVHYLIAILSCVLILSI